MNFRVLNLHTLYLQDSRHQREHFTLDQTLHWLTTSDHIHIVLWISLDHSYRTFDDFVDFSRARIHKHVRWVLNGAGRVPGSQLFKSARSQLDVLRSCDVVFLGKRCKGRKGWKAELGWTLNSRVRAAVPSPSSLSGRSGSSGRNRK